MKKRYPKRTRRRLLQAAYRHFYRRGFQSAGLNDILADAGVTKGALYHHFSQKRELGYAVLEEHIAPLIYRRWIKSLENGADPLAELREMFHRNAAEMREEDIVFGCPLSNLAIEVSPLDEGFRTRINDIYISWSRVIAEALERGKAAGIVRSTIDVTEAADFIVGAVSGCRGMAKQARSGALLEAGFRQLELYLEALRT